MPSLVESDTAFVYGVPIPSVSRRIAIAFAAFFVCCFAFFPFKLGLDRSIYSIRNDPSLWLMLVAMFGSGFVFCLVLAFPPISWRARIEITREGIRYFPGPPLRWMGEPATEVRVGTDVREVLICQGSQDRFDGFFEPRAREYVWGYRIVLRSEGGQTRELKVATGDRLSLRQAEVLSDGIAAAIGIPVRLIKREVSETGALREITWTPVARSVNLAGMSKLAVVATPFLGGLAMGITRPRGLIVIAVAVCLWLLQTFAVYLYATITKQRSKFAALYWLTTAISFAGAYAVVFFLTANIVHGR